MPGTRRFPMRGYSLSCVVLLTLAAGQSSSAATIAVDLAGSGLQNGSPVNVTIGWGFTLATPLTVTDPG